MHDQTLSPASIRSRSESWCPEGLREALASESDEMDRQKRRFQSSQEALSRQGEEEGGGRRVEGKERGGRREKGGGRSLEGRGGREGEGRRREYSRQYKARTYLFSRSLLAASTIMLEAMDEQGFVSGESEETPDRQD